MPFRRKPRPRRRRRKTYRKVQRKDPNKAVVLSYPGYNFLPSRVLTKLRYVYSGITVGSVLSESHVFRGNSIYDPDYAVGGAQPLARDQLATLYNSYRVHKSTAKLTVTNNSAVPCQFVLLSSSIATAPASITTAKEQPYSKNAQLSNYQGGLASKTLRASQKTKTILGIREIDDDEEALMANNPDNEWYWHVMMDVHPYTGTNYLNVAWYLEIVYWVEAFDRIQLAAS